MSEVTRMVINDPSKFHLLATDMKLKMIEGAIATVNILASKARKESIKNIKNNFTIRNTFTARQIQFTPMPKGRYSLSAIQSTVGITEKASYMVRQEEGGEHTPSKGKTLAIPTDKARGGSKYNAVQTQMRLSRVKKKIVRSKKRGNSHEKNKQLFLGKVAEAYEKNKFIAMGGKGNRKNLHIITAFKKTTGGVTFKSKQVYKLSQRKTVTKKQPWLKPACEEAAKNAQSLFISQMKKLGM